MISDSAISSVRGINIHSRVKSTTVWPERNARVVILDNSAKTLTQDCLGPAHTAIFGIGQETINGFQQENCGQSY